MAHIEVEQARALLRDRIFMPDTVLYFGLVKDDQGAVADAEHVLAEPQRDEVAPSDRPHEKQFQGQRHLHQSGVGKGIGALAHQPSVNALRQHEQLLDVRAVDKLLQRLLRPRPQARRLRRQVRPIALEARERHRIDADGMFGNEHQHVGDHREHLAWLVAVAVEVELERSSGGVTFDQCRQRLDRIERTPAPLHARYRLP